jgi:hypothetical protein
LIMSLLQLLSELTCFFYENMERTLVSFFYQNCMDVGLRFRFCSIQGVFFEATSRMARVLMIHFQEWELPWKCTNLVQLLLMCGVFGWSSLSSSSGRILHTSLNSCSFLLWGWWNRLWRMC